MPDPSWPCSPPDVNYLRLVGSGAGGTATTIASGVAWQTLMGCNEIAFSLSTLNTSVTALNFEGIGGLSSMTAVTGLNTALQLLAGWVQEKPPIAASAVAAYDTAVSTMIPAAVSVANRVEQAADVQTNPWVWGALTPAIIALDAEYFGEHWPHNASAGAAYGAALTALVSALAVPPPLVPPGAPPAAPEGAAAAVAQAAGQETSLPMQSAMQPLQSAMGAIQPVTGMFQAPMQAFQGLSDLPQSMMGPLGAISELGSGEATPVATPFNATASEAGGFAGGRGGGTTYSGYPGAGLTSYTRPTSSFAPENAGRPTSLKGGLLSTADFRGPTNPGTGCGAPISPAQTGMLGHKKHENDQGGISRARIVLVGDPGRDAQPS